MSGCHHTGKAKPVSTVEGETAPVVVTPRVGILFTPEELRVVQDALRWADREWGCQLTTLAGDPARRGAVGLQDMLHLHRGIAREVRTRMRTKARTLGIEFAD
jgi:hypothetical protein